jgi:hypothetical protein
MTEQEWLADTDPQPKIVFLNDRDASVRKFRLFSCACARRVWDLMAGDHPRDVVVATERFADGLLTEVNLRVVAQAFRDTYPPRMTPDYPVPPSYVAGMVAYYTAWTNSVSFPEGLHLNEHGTESVCAWARFARVLHETGLWEWEYPHDHPTASAEAGYQCRLLRCIFGNPIRSVAYDPTWRTAAVFGLAEAIYADRAFDRLPILADALEDAGCDDRDMLAHCRTDPDHARGCWVVDLILGKN